MRAPGPAVELLTEAPPAAQAPLLDEVQAAAAAARTGAQLLLGPAGSGKTTVLVEAFAGRLLQGQDAATMLGLAATQSAARRWRAAIGARTGTAGPTITTVHGYALQQVLADAAARLADPPRLLASSDQVAIVRDVVAAHPGPWPALFADAVGTRHFAERARDFIGRAGLAGWTPDTLAGAERGVEVWTLLADVWRRYRRVLALSGAMDYTDLLMRAADLASHRAGRGPLRCIAVDSYHELDVLQIGLLRGLRPAGARLLAAADPDQTTDRFRGAAADAPARFSADFPDAAPVVVLRGAYRFAGPAEEVRARLAADLPMAGLPAAAVRAHRQVRSGERRCTVDVIGYDNAFAEAAGIAGLVRRFAAASGGAPRWSDAAVLVRSAGQAEVVATALLSAGIPVRREDSGRWLTDEPVVGVLATGLRLAAARAGLGDAQLDPAGLADLLVSGMGGADPHQVRRLLQRLRRDETAAAALEGRPARGSHLLLAAAGDDPAVLAGLDPRRYPAVSAVRAMVGRLDDAAAIISRGGGVDEVLWVLWSDQRTGSGSWARALRNQALSGGPAAAAAHRDLDAALALFAEARRSAARGGPQQVLDFLGALPGLRIPGDRLGSVQLQSGAVTLVTAHRAKDRQWPLVVVAGVQEGVWPGDGGGLGLLGEELLDDPHTTAVSVRQARVADERRLFLLACTRASRHLVVTCAAAGERDPGGPQPSRFIADLGVPLQSAPRPPGPRPGHVGVVVDLRRAAVGTRPQLADAAVERLAGLAADPDFPLAPPQRWWSLGAATIGTAPLLDPAAPVTLTVTGLAELDACPWRWFATRMLYAGGSSELSAGIGRVVHRVHEAWANSEIERSVPAAEQIVSDVWRVLPFDADWQSQRRLREVLDSLERLLVWQEANADRIAFAERSFEVLIDLPDGQALELRGKADMGVANADGSLAVLDLKTAKSPPTRAQVQRHVQLAGYQAAVAAGALAQEQASAGAGLLMASVADAGAGPKVLWQEPLDLRDPAGAWFSDILATAVGRVRGERFPAIESPACRTCPVTALCPAKNPAQEVGA